MALTLTRYEDSEGEPGEEEEEEEDEEEDDEEEEEEEDGKEKPVEGELLPRRKGAPTAKEPLSVPSLTRFWV